MSARGLLHRLGQAGGHLAWGNPIYRLSLGARPPLSLAVIPQELWAGEAEAGRLILDGHFAFSGQVRKADPPEWLSPGTHAAWRDEAHSFAWLRDLRAVGGDRARRAARRLVDAWIAAFPGWNAEAWKPRRLAGRIVVWLAGHDFFLDSADEDFRARIFASLSAQGRHLAHIAPRLEGMDRLKALKALVYVALCLPGHEPRLEPALAGLSAALDAQLRPDGSHAGRNPEEMLGLLADLIDLKALMARARHPLPLFIQHAIDRLTPGVRFFLHGDGGLAQFNGASRGASLSIRRILQLADMKGRPLKSMPHGGFERVAAGRSLLLVDAGAPPAAGLDRTCHAGLLSFEFSVGRQRLVVNCGGAPGAGELGEALRATAAHSTACAGDTNAIGLCEAGPLTRRPSRIGRERHQGEGGTLLELSHDGWQAPLGLTWRRTLFLSDDGEDLRGEEVFAGRADVPVALRFHLDPEVHVALTHAGDAAWLMLSRNQGWRFKAARGALTLEEGLVALAPGQLRRSRQLVLSTTTRTGGTTLLNWALQRWRQMPAELLAPG